MLALGMGMILTEQISMNIAYHYFDLGRVETSPGNMYMDTRPAGITVNGIESHLRTHGLALGLRYQFSSLFVFKNVNKKSCKILIGYDRNALPMIVI